MEFYREKKYDMNFKKNPKTHNFSKIITKYESITPKTPKVRIIFSYFLDFTEKKNFTFWTLNKNIAISQKRKSQNMKI